MPLRGPGLVHPKGPRHSPLESGLRKAMTQGGSLALEIIMLCFGRTSFWFFVYFFGVFNYLKNDQKEVLQLNSLADIAH